ncbi:unnamed protein product [Urochloa humidicola]
MPIQAEGLPRKIADPFDYGGGHINPNRAADPGLIYDNHPNDYNYFSCVIKKSVSCNATSVPGYLLNLPSISVPDLRYPVTVSRTVTNVGEVDAVYHVAIESPAGVKMEVEPSVSLRSTLQTKFIHFRSSCHLCQDYKGITCSVALRGIMITGPCEFQFLLGSQFMISLQMLHEKGETTSKALSCFEGISWSSLQCT